MKLYTLRDLLQIKNGKDHKHLGYGEIPVFGSGGIMRYGDKAIFENESILLPRKGTLSNIQYVNKPFWTVDTLYYTVVNKNLADTFYLYNLLKILDLSSLNSGTGVPSMTFDAYYDLKILLPELAIQQKIASVLSSLDSKIQLNNRINAELEAMAKTIYDYWFVQFDFPDKNGKPYKTSGGKMVWNHELKREIPEQAIMVKMSELYEFQYGLGNINPDNGGTYPVYGSNGVIGSYDKFNNEDAPVIGHIGNNCGSLVFAIGKHYVTYNGVMCKIKEGFDKYFGYAVLLSKDLKSQTRGSSQQFISYDILNSLDVIIPDIKIMNSYRDFVTPLFDKVNNDKKENQQLSHLRDWLLPMLMNGQVTMGKAFEQVDEVLGMVAEDKG